MPTLPLKPLSSSNNFSTYISFLPPLKKKQPYFFSKTYFKVVGAGMWGYQKAHPQPGLRLCPRWPQCGAVQKQLGGPVHRPRLRKPFLWRNLDSDICGRKAGSRPSSVLSFLGHLVQTRKWTCDDSVDFS